MQENTAENLISSAAADALINAHDGDVALLYLYYTRTGTNDAEAAAAALCRTLGEIKAAEEKLGRLGLSARPRPQGEKPPIYPPAPPIKDERPSYTAAEVHHRAGSDAYFNAVIEEAKKEIGRNLSGSELKTLLNIYDNLAMPFDVMLMLINYCAELNRERFKGQRRLSTYFIEKEAYEWAQNEIVNTDLAENYIKHAEDRRANLNRLSRSMGIQNRKLTKNERSMMEAWLAAGFGQEEIMLAYERTVDQTGDLSIRYMNAIIERWRTNGLLTVKEINEKDPPRSAARKSRRTQKAQTQPDMGSMEEILSKI